ncbi:MAG: TIGR03862 family flavoprotein [Paracoccaceae bacterium]|nr:TIGR03862 family flavoprotein [Paracoccaceae bacterium]
MTSGLRHHALVIGAGPAGLMAADRLSALGIRVTMVDAMPSVGRKFLMAGKSGLNLTKSEPADVFGAVFSTPDHLAPMLAKFGAGDVGRWAQQLGCSTFVGSSGRVFPDVMKASPLLRSWMHRLNEAGVTLNTRWRWTGWDGTAAMFDTPQGVQSITADATVLALGGSSWSRLGSDGKWATTLADHNVELAAFGPVNMGFGVEWSDHMHAHFGSPLKSIRLITPNTTIKGECVISNRGLEGSAIYAVSRDLRDSGSLAMDLIPDVTIDQAAERLAKPRGKTSLSNHLRKALRLDDAKRALLNECTRPLPQDPMELAKTIKSLPIPITGPHPIDEAISTSGGVAWSALDEQLMLNVRDGVFCAGEMLDWDAPTGGYLITGCLSTGRWAGDAAAAWIRANP